MTDSYKQLADKESKVIFGGRLGEYKYYDMDQVIAAALERCRLECIFRKNCASVPEERSAIPLQTEQSSAGLLVAIIYSTIPARKFKTICLGCHSA